MNPFRFKSRTCWVRWTITRACNFRCDYCFFADKEVYDVLPADKILRALRRTGRRWEVFITGGEPFIVPGFTDICSDITRDFTLALNTNLSFDAAIRDFAGRIPPRRVRLINAAFHIAENQRRGRVEAFIENLRLLKDRGFRVNAKCVVHPVVFGQFLKYHALFKSKGLKLNPSPFFGVFEGRTYPDAYSPEELRFLVKHRSDVREHLPVYPKGVRCRAGQSYVVVTRKGVFRRCPHDRRPLGTIEKGIRLDRRPWLCSVERCNCWGSRTVVKTPAGLLRLWLNKKFYRAPEVCAGAAEPAVVCRSG